MGLEKGIETCLKDGVKSLGGIAFKIWCLSFSGLPDRLVLLPFRRIWFVELKAPKKEPSEIQNWVHGLLRKLGFTVLVLDTKEKVKTFLKNIQMITYVERPGSPGIYTSQGDYIGSIEDDTIRAQAIEGLNGPSVETIDGLESQILNLEDELANSQNELKEFKVENGVMLANLKSLHDNDLFDIDDFLDKYEGIEDTLPQEFFAKVRKLNQRVYKLTEENFGEEIQRPSAVPVKRRSSRTKA